MGLLDLIKGKKIDGGSREELEKLAALNNVVFTEKTTNDALVEMINAAVLKPKEVLKGVLKVKILLPVAGRFGLSCGVGETCDLDANQAQELIEAKHAEKVENV